MTMQTAPAGGGITSLNFGAFDTAATSLQSSATALQEAITAMQATNTAAMPHFSGLAATQYSSSAVAALRKGSAILGVVGVAAQLLAQIRDDLRTKDAGLGLVTNIHITTADGSALPGGGNASSSTTLSFGVGFDRSLDTGQGATASQANVPFILP